MLWHLDVKKICFSSFSFSFCKFLSDFRNSLLIYSWTSQPSVASHIQDDSLYIFRERRWVVDDDLADDDDWKTPLFFHSFQVFGGEKLLWKKHKKTHDDDDDDDDGSGLGQKRKKVSFHENFSSVESLSRRFLVVLENENPKKWKVHSSPTWQCSERGIPNSVMSCIHLSAWQT